jgi:hypothetical protein
MTIGLHVDRCKATSRAWSKHIGEEDAMLDRSADFEGIAGGAGRAIGAAGRRPKPESLAAHVEMIRRRHRAIDSFVEFEQRRPAPDAAVLRSLKRERLRLRDELSSYEGLLRVLERRPGQA